MKLRGPCQHDHYEEHPCIDGNWVSQMRMLRITDEERSLLSMCPGGVFLPDDTLVIEKNEQGLWPEWFTNALGEGWWQAHIASNKRVAGSVIAGVLGNALSVREAE